MISFYQHKKNLFFSLSRTPLKSRYVLPYYPQTIPKNSLQITRYARQIRITYGKTAKWIALVSDAGMQVRYLEPNQATSIVFPIQNEQPLMIYIGIDEQKILQYSLSSSLLR